MQRFGLEAVTPQPADNYFEDWWQHASNSVSNSVVEGLNYLVILGAWVLWKHRNDCVFNGVSPSLSAVLAMAGDEVRLWSMAEAKGIALLTRHDA